MTRDEIVALVARLDPGAEVTFELDGHARVVAGADLTEAGLAELLHAAPDAQVAFGAGSPLITHVTEALTASVPTGAGYELDDLEEDGTFKPGHRPAGWGTLP